jgi:hypothetical protein
MTWFVLSTLKNILPRIHGLETRLQVHFRECCIVVMAQQNRFAKFNFGMVVGALDDDVRVCIGVYNSVQDPLPSLSFHGNVCIAWFSSEKWFRYLPWSPFSLQDIIKCPILML